MRITIVGALLLGMSLASKAQSNIYEVNGNVGIGTASPAAKLNINTPASDSMSSSLKLGIANDAGNYGVPMGGVTGAYNIDFATWRDMAPDQVGARIRAERINTYSANAAYVQAMDLAFYTSDGWGLGRLSEKFRIKHNGYIGIGTSAPANKLTLDFGSTRDAIRIFSDGDASAYSDMIFEIKTKTGIPYGKPHSWVISSRRDGHFSGDASGNTLEFYANLVGGGYTAPLSFKSNGDVILSAPHQAITGNVGIGTTTPDEKLTVNGKVHAKEIKVNNNIWPDYVFKPSYSLMPLHKVETFIKKNGHLPEVPSAKEVEEKGIEVGANQALLLKKIEELTLHIIEQDKRIRTLENRLK